MAEKRFDRNDYQMSGTCNNREDVLVKMSLFNELLDTAEYIQNQLDAEKQHSQCLQDELDELQSEDIRNMFPDEAIDMASMLIHDDKYHPCDLQEIAEHLQAYVKNTWGE